jgi:hypothetical protein
MYIGCGILLADLAKYQNDIVLIDGGLVWKK